MDQQIANIFAEADAKARGETFVPTPITPTAIPTDTPAPTKTPVFLVGRGPVEERLRLLEIAIGERMLKGIQRIENQVTTADLSEERKIELLARRLDGYSLNNRIGELELRIECVLANRQYC